MSRLYFKNARVLTEARVLPGGAVSVEDGRITGVFGRPREALEGETVVDAGGLWLAPGFVDVHVHGGDGHDFMCGDALKVQAAAHLHLQHGTTTMAATVSTAERETFLKAMDAIDLASRQMPDGPWIPGLHLEGPYFAMSQRGAQSPRHVRDPDPAEYMQIAERFPNILRWAVAPELPGALEMARRLVPRGIRMSIGHSDALFDEVVLAYEAGFRCVTHFYSGCSSMRRVNAYRYAGIVEAGYLIDDLWLEVIADGKHLPPSLLKLIHKVKGPDRIMLITDAISAAGQKGVTGEIYSQTCDSMVIIEDDVAKMPDRTSFAGSVATTDRLVRTMVKLAEVPMREAVLMASATPARHLGIFARKGSIAEGKDADLLLFDDDIRIRKVFFGGREVFARGEE